jgi:hypothetical protein
MHRRTRIEHRRLVRRGERTLVVRVIEYPAPRHERPDSQLRKS